MIGLGLAGDITLRPPLISPSSLSSLFTFHSASLLLWGFFFFWLQFGIWVDLILVSNYGGWFAVEVLLRQWILVAGGCAVDVVDDNGRGDNILF